MKFIMLGSVFFSMSAFATNYENWMGSAAVVECKSSGKIVVSTFKTNVVQDKGFEYVKNIEVYAKAKIGSGEFKRRYIIDTVLIDVRAQDGSEANAKFRPTIVSGRHHSTRESFLIEVEAGTTESGMDFAPAKLIIGGELQKQNALQCRVVFAG